MDLPIYGYFHTVHDMHERLQMAWMYYMVVMGRQNSCRPATIHLAIRKEGPTEHLTQTCTRQTDGKYNRDSCSRTSADSPSTLAQLGIGIEQTNANIGIPAFIISVLYWTKKMLDFIGLVQYRTSPGIISFFHSGTRLIGCWTVRHSSIFTHAHAWTLGMEKDMHHRHGDTSAMNAGMPIKC